MIHKFMPIRTLRSVRCYSNHYE